MVTPSSDLDLSLSTVTDTCVFDVHNQGVGRLKVRLHLDLEPPGRCVQLAQILTYQRHRRQTFWSLHHYAIALGMYPEVVIAHLQNDMPQQASATHQRGTTPERWLDCKDHSQSRWLSKIPQPPIPQPSRNRFARCLLPEIVYCCADPPVMLLVWH